MPLYQDTDSQKILYISSVVLQISASDHSNVHDIAGQIAAHFSATYGEILSVKIVSPAWIHLELTDPALADWLHCLTTTGTRLEETGEINQVKNQKSTVKIRKQGSSKSFLTIQYAHARCCSLLRLADREGLIQLLDSSTAVLGLRSAQPIPWLDCNQKLRLHQPDEVRLIHQLVKMVDDLVFTDSNSSVNWETAALKLSAAFDNFWCNCRIWGEVKINSWELAQARLGLLIATQLVLRSVLETKLGVFAPLEL
ncbi:DALR anticodon-binding domain-containing protein [Anabaena sp. UHCC 0451]|uniref:DALR anticodon-binding domain-containing protein n=1 Tax=Anabaena sp. UHCC 0451 TaxID=2055235 RepID=UPI002B20A3F2|nr:DALR anticodon-binding domain-containing protein [Anabaena sp. UHCC 0451]MEA5578544.1 DALR anticodon-binding domain-containing protein [Anabaena sp. UHCC 0451]